MISAESDMVISYYKDNLGVKFLSPRPKKLDAPKSKLAHQYGVKMTGYSKPHMIGYMQSWVVDYARYCPFRDLINELLAYDEENIGTDWDIADALGIMLCRINDMNRKPRAKQKDNEYRKNIAGLTWRDGTIVSGNKEDIEKALNIGDGFIITNNY
jgi:hypothetical protein